MVKQNFICGPFLIHEIHRHNLVPITYIDWDYNFVGAKYIKVFRPTTHRFILIKSFSFNITFVQHFGNKKGFTEKCSWMSRIILK